jgi:membrane protease YdiL (CAAX protease family)
VGNRLRAGWRLTIQLIVNIGFYLVLILIASRSDTSVANSFWGIIVLAFAVTGLTLLSVWLAGRFLDRRHFSDFGIHLKNHEWWADIGFALVLGLVLPIGVAFLGNVVGWITVESVFASGIAGIAFIPAIIVSAYLYICVGIYEEVARAYHIRNLFEGSQWLGLQGAMVVAIVGASAISVIMHRGNELFLLFVFITAAIKGLTYFLTSRIAIALAHHAAWDFAVATVLGFGVQSNGSTNATFFLVHLGDTIQPSQGAVSLPVLLALIVVEIVGLFIILGWIRLRYGKVKLHEGFVESNRYSLENG